MDRETETKKDDKSRFENTRHPYEKALIKDWQGFKEFYDSHPPDALFYPLTVNGDKAFHIAAASKDALLVTALLDKLQGRSEKFKAFTEGDNYGNTALHKVATTNCVRAAKWMVDVLLNNQSSESDNEEESKLLIPSKLRENARKLLIRNNLGETPLYMAAAHGRTKMAQFFAKQIDANVLHQHFVRADKMSILHMAIISEKFETAIWLLEMKNELAKSEEKNGMTGFHLLASMPSAFASSRPRNLEPMVNIFEDLVYSYVPIDYYKDKYTEEEEEELPSSPGKDLETGKNGNNILQAKNQTATSKMWIGMWTYLIKGYPKIKKIWKEKRKHELASKLTKLLVEEDTSWTESYEDDVSTTISSGLGSGSCMKEQKLIGEINTSTTLTEKSLSSSTEASNDKEKKRCSEAPLVMAAKSGIVEIVDSMLRKYPQAAEYTSYCGQNMLHVAVLFRQKKIFDRVLGLEKKLVNNLGARIDNNGNTLLHHAAVMQHYRGGTRPSPALQLQEELQWFENVKEIVPSRYFMERNDKNKTAGDLFEEHHAKQLKSAQQWLKDNAESSSTVSILVATVVFAAAYTVPGGNNAQGFPIFLHSPLFRVFTVMDIVSLISSLCSLVMFLSILSSSFTPEAFLKSLPRKVTIGGFLLLFSVLSSMITFTAALLLLLRLKKRWTASVVYAAAVIPVVLAALVQYPLIIAFLAALTDFYQKFKWTSPKRKPRYLNSKT